MAVLCYRDMEQTDMHKTTHQPSYAAFMADPTYHLISRAYFYIRNRTWPRWVHDHNGRRHQITARAKTKCLPANVPQFIICKRASTVLPHQAPVRLQTQTCGCDSAAPCLAWTPANQGRGSSSSTTKQIFRANDDEQLVQWITKRSLSNRPFILTQLLTLSLARHTRGLQELACFWLPALRPA